MKPARKKSTNVPISVYTNRHMQKPIADTQQASSARDLRQQMRSAADDSLATQLFTALSQTIYQNGWDPQASTRLLQQLCESLGAAHGLIALKTGNTLTVEASRGNYYPLAARIPLTGKLAALLKYPCAFQCSQDAHPLWASQPAGNLSTFIIPVAYQQSALGIIGFAKSSDTVTQRQLDVCQSVGGVLALHWHKNTHPAQTLDLSVLERLTPREREVFALLPSGKSNAELGKLLGISGGTVKIHVERIFSKLDLNDRTQAAVKAVSLGLASG